MTVYVLDTNAYSNWKRGHLELHHVLRSASRIVISAVVVGELLYGFRRGTRFDHNLEELERFLRSPRVEFVTVGMRTSDRYSRIAAALRAKGTPIPANDVWIAAHTFETGGELLSFDGHYERVDGLVWRKLRDDTGVVRGAPVGVQ